MCKHVHVCGAYAQNVLTRLLYSVGKNSVPLFNIKLNTTNVNVVIQPHAATVFIHSAGFFSAVMKMSVTCFIECHAGEMFIVNFSFS